jgi:hypothetical protein
MAFQAAICGHAPERAQQQQRPATALACEAAPIAQRPLQQVEAGQQQQHAVLPAHAHREAQQQAQGQERQGAARGAPAVPQQDHEGREECRGRVGVGRLQDHVPVVEGRREHQERREEGRGIAVVAADQGEDQDQGK